CHPSERWDPASLLSRSSFPRKRESSVFALRQARFPLSAGGFFTGDEEKEVAKGTSRALNEDQRRWIPAFAGMTAKATSLDRRFRGDDEPEHSQVTGSPLARG